MFARISKKKYKDKVYQSLHIVETYRDGDARIRQRMVANLGAVDKYRAKDIEAIISGLRRVFDLTEETVEADGPTRTSSLGGAHAIFKLWDQLGWSDVIKRHLRRDRYRFDVCANLKTLVANRLLDPSSKLHILEWLKSVYLPGVPRKEIDYNHLLRAMDFLERHKRSLEPKLAAKILDLFSTDVNIVFYDLTSTYFEIDEADDPEVSPGDEVSTLRRRGYSRDHRGDRPQVVIGLVMNQDGIPLAHHVFPGNTLDKTTLKSVAEDLSKRFRIRRCVFVGDRGMMTQENATFLKSLGFDFILAHPLRRNKEAFEVIDCLEKDLMEKIRKEKKRAGRKKEPPRELFVEVTLGERRFVVCHSEEIAAQTKKARVKKLKKADAFMRSLADKLDAQDEGETFRGRNLTDQGALIKIHDYLRDRKLLRYTHVHLTKEGTLTWESDEKARQWENRIDGKLILETSTRTLKPSEVVSRYKELQDIERCFRTLKSSLDLRPQFHRVDRRIRAHVFLCVMALQMDRIIRKKLRDAGIRSQTSRVLDNLARIVAVETQVEGRHTKALTTSSDEQLTFFKALGVPKPTHRDFSLSNPL